MFLIVCERILNEGSGDTQVGCKVTYFVVGQFDEWFPNTKELFCWFFKQELYNSTLYPTQHSETIENVAREFEHNFVSFPMFSKKESEASRHFHYEYIELFLKKESEASKHFHYEQVPRRIR